VLSFGSGVTQLGSVPCCPFSMNHVRLPPPLHRQFGCRVHKPGGELRAFRKSAVKPLDPSLIGRDHFTNSGMLSRWRCVFLRVRIRS